LLQPYIVMGTFHCSSRTRPARALLLERSGKAVDGDGAREDEPHVPPEARRLVLRHAKHVERPLDVDLVRELGIALAARREERGEVEHHVDLVVRRELVEQVPVHDVARVAPGLTLGDDRVREPDDVDALGEERGGHLLRKACVLPFGARAAHHDGHDGVKAGADAEARLRSSPAESGARFRARASRRARVPFEHVERFEARAHDDGGARLFENRYGRERWRRSSIIGARRRGEAAGRAAERLAERRRDDVDPPPTPHSARSSRARLADEAGRVAVVDHDHRR
jgi:hypothetical protein